MNLENSSCYEASALTSSITVHLSSPISAKTQSNKANRQVRSARKWTLTLISRDFDLYRILAAHKNGNKKRGAAGGWLITAADRSWQSRQLDVGSIFKYWLICRGSIGRCALAQRPPARWHSSARSRRLYACFPPLFNRMSRRCLILTPKYRGRSSRMNGCLASGQALAHVDSADVPTGPTPNGRSGGGGGADWAGGGPGRAGKVAHLGQAKPPPLPVTVYKTAVGHVHTLTHTLEELNGPLFGINAKVSWFVIDSPVTLTLS